MSGITACRPSPVESNPARRGKFRVAVRSVVAVFVLVMSMNAAGGHADPWP